MSVRQLPELAAGAERRLVLAASTGGHLFQLIRLAPGLGAGDDSLWITFRTPQSESLLEGRNVFYAPYIRPRDGLSVLQAFGRILPRVRAGGFDAAVSTGSALALAALSAARLAGVPSLYVESVARTSGPSLSGRILAGLRLAETRTQHPAWADSQWKPHPSVLSTYERVLRGDDGRVLGPRPSLFVTLGTIRGYGFPALVDRVLDTGLADERTVWQLGDTRVNRDLPGQVHREVSSTDYRRFATEADVVISHAGVGSVLGLLELGVCPVVVPRRASRGEHVDDHQHQLASLLCDLKVGHPVEVDDLGPEIVLDAASSAVVPAGL